MGEDNQRQVSKLKKLIGKLLENEFEKEKKNRHKDRTTAKKVVARKIGPQLHIMALVQRKPEVKNNIYYLGLSDELSAKNYSQRAKFKKPMIK